MSPTEEAGAVVAAAERLRERVRQLERDHAYFEREYNAVYRDLGRLCRALGLSDAARPYSPSALMAECIAAAERLREQADWAKPGAAPLVPCGRPPAGPLTRYAAAGERA